MFKRSASFKDTSREISKGLGRFFSIFAIVAIGVGFFVGIKATSPDMKLTADAYFHETNLMDLRLVSELGFEEEDVASVLYTEGVESVMPSYSTDSLIKIEDASSVVKIHAIPASYGTHVPLNTPSLISGRMPEKSGECVMGEPDFRSPFAYRLGDKIKLMPSSEDDELSDKLKTDSFTIVGFVNSPEYISMERGSSTIGSGSVHCYIMIPPEDFNFEVYTEIHVGIAGTREISAFSEEYAKIIDRAKEKLERLEKVRSPIRYNNVKNELNRKIGEGEAELSNAEEEMTLKLSEAQAEIDAAKEKISRSEQELNEGEEKFATEIADAEKKLDEGYKQYYEGKEKYEKEYAKFRSTKKDAEKKIADGERDLDQLDNEIGRLESELNSTSFFDPQRLMIYAQLNMMRYQYASGRSQLSQAKAELNSAERQLENAGKELNESKRELDKNKEELEQAKIDTQKQIEDARIEIENAKTELTEGEKEYEEKKAEAEIKISDAKNKLEDAKKLLEELSVPEWYILSRSDNPGYSGYRENAERLDGIATYFPFFFLLVAALVCLTTMTRMVEEQRGQIGIYKALGYNRLEVASKYFSYAMTAGLSGSLFGVLIGHILVPKVIYNAFDIMYSLPPIIIEMPWDIATASAAVAIACTAIAAAFACNKELNTQTAHLMRPKPPKPGKRVFVERISAVWSRMSFISKITSRNLLRYKLRFIMTVLGISGCMALMVAGFGLRDSVNAIVPKQFNEISMYDAVFMLMDDISEESMNGLKDELNKDSRISQSMMIRERKLHAVSENEKTQIILFIPEEPEKMDGFVALRETSGKGNIKLTDKGAIITKKLADMHGLKAGDTLTIVEDNKEYTAAIEGVAENYVQHYVYMTPQCYSKTFGEKPSYNAVNALTFKGESIDEEKLLADWLKKDSVFMAYSTSSIVEEFSDSIESLNVVVLVMIIAAGALAFVVLYNLTNINISERFREIATIKVLGFYNSEVSKFVFTENLVLTAIGIATGSALGIILHRFVVISAEVDIVMFAREIRPMSFIYAGFLTLLFSLVVNYIMHFRLKKISMVESLKSLD
ncbi:MAG: outer membrane-specific lipoprotein transporter subunit LolE [Firmicutes bacterium ADurb.Bin182]|nr:MAG: outer membrane-specific lipoprotein transporter subunit LolE [Firmicutes bacterium ADurb.Bin182]